MNGEMLTKVATRPFFERLRDINEPKGECAGPPRNMYLLTGKHVEELKLTHLRGVSHVEWGYGSVAVTVPTPNRDSKAPQSRIYICNVADLWATPDEARAEFTRRRRAELKNIHEQMERLQNLGMPVAQPM